MSEHISGQVLTHCPVYKSDNHYHTLVFDLSKISPMGSALILSIVAIYFIALLVIAWITSRGAGNSHFFIGQRDSRWYDRHIALRSDLYECTRQSPPRPFLLFSAHTGQFHRIYDRGLYTPAAILQDEPHLYI